MNNEWTSINKIYGSLSVKLKVKIEPDVFGLVYCVQKMQKLLLHAFFKGPDSSEWRTHTHTQNRFELTVGPVVPVWWTPAAPSPGCVWGVCLPGSAEDFCFETRPLTAGPLAGGPAPPGNPETQMRLKAPLPSVCFMASMKNAAIRIHHSSEQMK